jgi:hypothetical protein
MLSVQPDSRGLVPTIHDFSRINQDVDARHKAGHEEES